MINRQTGHEQPVAPKAGPKQKTAVEVAKKLASRIEVLRTDFDNLVGMDDYEADKVDVHAELVTAIEHLTSSLVQDFGDVLRAALPIDAEFVDLQPEPEPEPEPDV